MIELINVSKKYKDKTLFENVNIKIENPGIYSFIGENGCGKSTLLNIIAKNIKPTDGNVKTNFKTKKFITQKINLIEHLTIKEQFELLNVDSRHLKKVYLYSRVNQYPSQLSFGQRQRISILLCLYSASQVVLCDEPTSHLDNKSAEIIMNLIKRASRKKIILLVSHNHEFINKYSNAIYKIENKEIRLIANNHQTTSKKTYNKEKFYFKGYVFKSLRFYKKSAFILFVFFLIFNFLFLIYFNFKYSAYTLIDEEMEYLLDDNKFYLKECSLIKDNELKVKQCNNLSQTKISKLKEMGYEVDFSYDIFLNYLYNTSKISSISKDDMQLKEGRYPLRYNEIIATDDYKINQIINLSSNTLISSEKIDVYKNNMYLKVVGTVPKSTFYNNDKYYMDHILIEEYLNKQFLIGNKITLNEYYKGLDTDNYKYLVYLKDNENIKEIDQLNIEYQENSYNYYQNIKVISDKIDECIIYLMMFVIVSYIYYMIKIIYKKMVYKENEINFLLSINMTKKKIANLINKENFVIHLTAFITSFVSSFWIINIVFQTVRVDYKTCFIYLVISKLFNDYLCMCLLNKKVKI